MDDDPAVEPGLDAFSLWVPLPFRIGTIIVLGSFFSPMTRDLDILSDSLQVSGHGA